MNIRIKNHFFFPFSFLLVFLVYWPSLNGTPIWDDIYFWFDFIFKTSGYEEIFKYFSWPVSVSIQKFMLSVFGHKYFYYHTTNLLIHFANAYMVYRLGRVMRIRYAKLFFFVFLVHPAAVISTAWMIQIKTLLCMFFALLSFHAFYKGLKKTKWMIVAWVFFALSVFSKTASITLPVIFFYLSFRHQKLKKSYLLIPFFLVSFWSGYKILTSEVTLAGVKKASVITQTNFTVSGNDELIPTPVVVNNEVPPATIDVIPETPAPKSMQYASFRYNLILKTIHYYFWQSILPVKTEPVKETYFKKSEFEVYLHLFFLFIIGFLFWKTWAGKFLLMGYILILPFLGIIPAPYMNVTWVSDQHIYLAIPLFLAFWFHLLERVKKYRIVIPVIFAIVFSYKSFQDNFTYKNEENFYRKSLEYDRLNIAMVLNFSSYLIRAHRYDEALNLMHTTIVNSEGRDEIIKDQYFPEVLELYIELKQALQKE